MLKNYNLNLIKFYRRPILITGAHRSGTTWLGHIINQSDMIFKIHEPFNIAIDSYPHSPLNYWFEHIDEKLGDEKVKSYIESFQWNYKRGLNEKNGKNLKKLLYIIKSHFLKQYLYKDPIALTSAEWFYATFNAHVIISIRHPAAFVTSLMQKGWDFDFRNFTNQPKLISRYLNGYEAEISEYAKSEKTLFENAILLWKCLYQIVLFYQERYAHEWYFVKNEDLSVNPIKEFQNIFKYLNLDFSPSIEQEILKTTNAKITDEINRNSLENVKKWKNILSLSEIDQIKNETYPIWNRFYSEKDW